MKHLIFLIITIIAIKAVQIQDGEYQILPYANYTIEEYCAKLNYPLQTHYIQTMDGYILKYYRLQSKFSQIQEGLPHGLLDSSDSQIFGNTEDKALGFYFAQRGYDVWLGNIRGNFHSINHTSLDVRSKEFWDFSFYEMAIQDLPAAFSYITEHTKQRKINYMGHSQGTIIMHIALSEQIKQVSTKLDKLICLGPVAYTGNINSPFFKWLNNQAWLLPYFDLNKIYQFLPKSNNEKSIAVQVSICENFPPACEFVLYLLMDMDPTLDNYNIIDGLINHIPAGTSVQNMKHWKQLINTNKFQRFDYGSVKNMIKYGQSTPPAFDLSKITHDVHLFAGDTDELADPVDVIRLYNELTNSKGKTIKMYHLGHATFLFGKKMDFLEDVLKILQGY